MAPNPSINRLRALIFQFYREADEEKLRGGLDVNGMAEWTEQNGVQALNSLLKLQYGRSIDLSVEAPSPEEEQEMFSQVFAPEKVGAEDRPKSTATKRNSGNHQARVTYQKFNEEETRKSELANALESFFASVDPSLLTDEHIDNLVDAAMVQGPLKLLIDLRDRYGKELRFPKSWSQRLREDREKRENEQVEESSSDNQPQPVDPDFDELKVRQQLRIFYQKQDPEYLENPDYLDRVVELVQELGKEKVYNDLESSYKVSVLSVVEEHSKELMLKSPASNATSNRALSLMEIDDKIAAFDNIDQLRADLIRYYQKHDPVEVQNIDDVIGLGMEIGLAQLSEKIKQFYGESLIEFLQNSSDGQEMIETPTKIEKLPAKKPNPFKKKPNPFSKKPEAPKRLLSPPGMEKQTTTREPVPVPRNVPYNRFSDAFGQASRSSKNNSRMLPELPTEATTKNDNARPTRDLPQVPQPRPIYRESARPSSRSAPKQPPRQAPVAPKRELKQKKSRKEDMAVLKMDLIAYYKVYDPAKIETIDKVMAVARKLGRDDLDKRLIGFYGASIDSVKDGVDDESVSDVSAVGSYNGSVNEHVRRQSSSSTNAGAQQRQRPVPQPMSIAGSPRKNNDKKNRKKKKDKNKKKGNEKLKEDLKLYYMKFDKGKLGALDDILLLARRIGRNKLSQKLGELYPMALDDFIAQQGSSPSRGQSPPRPIPRQPVEEEVPETFDVKKYGVQVMPAFDPAAGFKLKKTGLDVSRTLGQKKKSALKASNKNPLYQLRNKNAGGSSNKRMTSAAMKLLSGTLAKSSDQTQVPGKFQEMAIPFSDGRSGGRNVLDGPCNNYRLEMSKNGVFGVCVCGFPKARHVGAALYKTSLLTIDDVVV